MPWPRLWPTFFPADGNHLVSEPSVPFPQQIHFLGCGGHNVETFLAITVYPWRLKSA